MCSNSKTVFGVNLVLLTAGLTVVTVLTWLPISAHALSCIHPDEMISRYANEVEYTIALVKPTSLETEGSSHEQEVEVLEVYKGDMDNTATVYFEYDETWQYLCAGSPAEVGEEVMYVISGGRVSQTSAPDSDFSSSLLAEINEEDSEASSVEPPVAVPPLPSNAPPILGEDILEEMEKRTLMMRVISLLQQLVSLLSV